MKKKDQPYYQMKTAEDHRLSQRAASLATLVLVAQTQVQAQYDDDDDVEIFQDGGRSGRFIEEEEFEYDDMPIQFSYRRYRHELNSLFWMAMALFAVNKLIRPRHRRGCSIIVVFFFVVYYVLSHVLRLI